MESAFRPSPDNVIATMWSVVYLAENLSTTPGPEWATKNLSAAECYWGRMLEHKGHLQASLRHAGLLHLPWDTKDQENFRRVAADWHGCKGWNEETVVALLVAVRAVLLWIRWHPDEPMTAADAAGIVAVARRVQAVAERQQAGMNHAMEVGRQQRERAITAGKSREPITIEQQQQAAEEIQKLIMAGKKEQTACKELSKKYGVHFKTLKRYYRRTVD